MKNEIEIPILGKDLNEKDLLTAAEHRRKYSLARDLRAEDFNRAIFSRFVKDKEMQEHIRNESIKQIKCEKCGKEFSPGTAKDIKNCPDCNSSDNATELID